MLAGSLRSSLMMVISTVLCWITIEESMAVRVSVNTSFFSRAAMSLVMNTVKLEGREDTDSETALGPEVLTNGCGFEPLVKKRGRKR